MREIKKAVIWEDLVGLTGDYRDAVILSQLLYWLPRMRDTDAYLTAERERMARSGAGADLGVSHGWIYKTAEELSKETMMGLAVSTTRKCLQRLVDRGWVQQRHNPKYQWDRTWQYRVDLVRLEQDLRDMGKGYTLAAHGIVLDATDDDAISSHEKGNPFRKNGHAPGGNGSANPERSNFAGEKAIPDNTSNTTSESISTFNTKHVKAVAVDEVSRFLEKILGVSVKTLKNLPSWIDTFGNEYLLEKAQLVKSNTPVGGWKNILGVYYTAVEQDWEDARLQLQTASSDPRYTAFYELYPELKSQGSGQSLTSARPMNRNPWDYSEDEIREMGGQLL